MAKTKEEIKEYNRLKQQEKRAKLKLDGIPLNNPTNTANQRKRIKELGLKAKSFIGLKPELIAKFEGLKGSKTDNQFLNELISFYENSGAGANE